jgi:D-cysteine desulfhydrase
VDRRQFLGSSLLLAAQPLLPSERKPDGLLLERFPKLCATLPRLTLTERPIPVTSAQGLGERLGLAHLYVKRDDLACTTYAGSKVCKLEYLLGQARALGHSHLVTGGGVGSHHALATALHGSQQGFSVELLLMPEPPSEEARRVLTASAHYAQVIRYVPTARDLTRQWQQALERRPGSTHSIPLGGTSPLGNVAYIEAALELEQQVERGLLPEPTRIYVALGTMGCVVGLSLGLRLTRLKSRIIAVRASNPDTSSPHKLRRLYDATQQWLRARDASFPELPIDETALIIDGRHLGVGYAIPTEEGKRAMMLARERERLQLDLTYTAKALAAIVADAPRLGGQPVLLWNTHAGAAPDCPLQPQRLPKQLLSYLVTREK